MQVILPLQALVQRKSKYERVCLDNKLLVGEGGLLVESTHDVQKLLVLSIGERFREMSFFAPN